MKDLDTARSHPSRRSISRAGLAAALTLGILASAAQAKAQKSPPEPRIPPLESSQSPLNLLKTLANHPQLIEAWGPFGGYIVRNSTLPPRDRELLILRTVFLCGAEYEWGHHTRGARQAGIISDEEILRITEGPETSGWSSFDRALLRAASELHRSSTISDRTWAYLDARYDEKQLMDVVFTVGQYNMVSMALRSFRVPMDEGLEGFPD